MTGLPKSPRVRPPFNRTSVNAWMASHVNDFRDSKTGEMNMTRRIVLTPSVITDDNLASIDKPREAVSVAKDLAAIADRTTAKQAGNQTAVFIHMTREKSEAEYGDIIVLDHVPDVKRKE